MIFNMSVSVAISPSLFTQSSLATLLNSGVQHVHIPVYSTNWVEAFGTHIQPTSTREFQPVTPDVFMDLFGQIHAAGAEITAVLDGELSSENERLWLAQTLAFLDAHGVKQVCISSPAIPLLFSEKFPRISWVASSSALIYSVPAAQFWADLGIYRIVLPYQMTGAEALAAIHYASHLPLKFSVPILGYSQHRLNGACHADCYWVDPAICQTQVTPWLEPDITQDIEFVHALQADPASSGTWHDIAPEFRYAYAKKVTEQFAIQAAFRPAMPLKCGACFMPKIAQIPDIQMHINGVRVGANRLIQDVQWIINSIHQSASQAQIQKDLNLPTVCNSRQWCLYPDQVEARL